MCRGTADLCHAARLFRRAVSLANGSRPEPPGPTPERLAAESPVLHGKLEELLIHCRDVALAALCARASLGGCVEGGAAPEADAAAEAARPEVAETIQDAPAHRDGENDSAGPQEGGFGPVRTAEALADHGGKPPRREREEEHGGLRDILCLVHGVSVALAELPCGKR